MNQFKIIIFSNIDFNLNIFEKSNKIFPIGKIVSFSF